MKNKIKELAIKVWRVIRIYVIILLSIIIGGTAVFDYQGFKSLFTEYNKSIIIINDHFEKKSDAEAVRASEEVSLDGDGDTFSPYGDEQSSPSIEETGTFYAYNSEVSQTDSDPYTMASGKTVYNGAIANNCLPFGTDVEILGIVFTVDDRMNERYGCDTFDVWMGTKDEALRFGKQELPYKIL